MSKNKRIRSRKKHDKEILRHMKAGDLTKVIKTISKDPNDDGASIMDRVVMPELNRILKRVNK